MRTLFARIFHMDGAHHRRRNPYRRLNETLDLDAVIDARSCVEEFVATR